MDSRKWTAGSGWQEVDSRKWMAGGGQQEVDGRRWTAGGGRQEVAVAALDAAASTPGASHPFINDALLG